MQFPDFPFGSSSWGWVLYPNKLKLSQIRCHPVAQRSKNPRNWEGATCWMVDYESDRFPGRCNQRFTESNRVLTPYVSYVTIIVGVLTEKDSRMLRLC